MTSAIREISAKISKKKKLFHRRTFEPGLNEQRKKKITDGKKT